MRKWEHFRLLLDKMLQLGPLDFPNLNTHTSIDPGAGNPLKEINAHFPCPPLLFLRVAMLYKFEPHCSSYKGLGCNTQVYRRRGDIPSSLQFLHVCLPLTIFLITFLHLFIQQKILMFFHSPNCSFLQPQSSSTAVKRDLVLTRILCPGNPPCPKAEEWGIIPVLQVSTDPRVPCTRIPTCDRYFC